MNYRYFMVLFFLLALMTDTLRGSDHLDVELSGRILKKHFEVPNIVKNPSFGWFVELDPQSVKCMHSVVDQLEADDRRMISDFD